MKISRNSVAGILILSICACAQAQAPTADAVKPYPIDQLSYQLGGFSSFAEIVSLGIKKLALSAAVSAGEMESLYLEATRIAAKAGVEIYREPEFMVSDLFPVSATKNKHVILIYQGTTLTDYFSLKDRKQQLVANGRYQGKERAAISWAMGKLLSYPDSKISELISKNNDKQ